MNLKWIEIDNLSETDYESGRIVQESVDCGSRVGLKVTISEHLEICCGIPYVDQILQCPDHCNAFRYFPKKTKRFQPI
jgi:hypothetical protein